MQLYFNPIGIIHTPFIAREGMPIQSPGASGVKGTVELNEDLTDGLLHLSGFSHIYLIYYFHRSEGYQLYVTPFLDNQVHGVFATRAPKRPNQIGLSVVKLLSVKKNILEIENVDILDGTPLLDIKPYVPAFDVHKTQKCGWLTEKVKSAANTQSDNRFKL
jgi:tRNA-Thr(GGU) m(6)t(6)A37 methyltransferase TsaA